MRGLGRLMLVLLATMTVGASAVALAPEARAARPGSPAPSGLVTHTMAVTMTCSDGTDPAGTGLLDHVLTNLVVQVTAPAVVPFGGSVTYTGLRYAVTMASNPYGAASTTLYAGPATHLVPEGHTGFGTALQLPSPGRYTSSGADFGAVDVRGPVGSVVSLPVEQLTASWYVDIPGYGGITFTEHCTPASGTPPLATTVIGPPPGGAPASDQVILAVRDQTTGAVVYQVDTFISTGNFLLAPPGDGVHVIGTSTFPGLAGGTASFTLVSTRKTLEIGGGAITFSTTLLSLSDPGASVGLNGVSNQTVYGGPELNSVDIWGVASGTLAGSGHPAVISWEIRDLA